MHQDSDERDASGSQRLTMAVVTPSYAPDRELCGDLNRSVLRFTGADVHHHIVVPSPDMKSFESLAGRRTTVHRADQFLPREMVRIPSLNVWMNLRRPYPPVRGWIAQQIVKMSIAASLNADIVLLVDSDIVLIRPIDAYTYAPSGSAALYRLDNGIDASLPRHRLWHQVSRRLLGLPPTRATLLPDYICWPCAWQPDVVRSMLKRIERSTGKPWETAVGSEIHFSEMILYGVYVEHVLGLEGRAVSPDMRCLNHSEEVSLDVALLRHLLSGLKESDVAVMVSAKSRTALADRREALADYIGNS